MKFPEKYIKHGEFTLHSGQTSGIFYDVNALMADRDLFEEVLRSIPEVNHYVGIATGGAVLARTISYLRNAGFSMIKDGELKGEVPMGGYLLIDDVATTETSLREAIKIIGKIPSAIFVVLDRRSLENRILGLNSLFQI